MKIEQKLIIAEPYTILIEGDKKTTVKANDEDYNQFKGVVMALLQHKLGMSYSKLKYLLYDMKKGDEELVLARFLLRQEGIDTNKINRMIREADIQETKISKERKQREVDELFEKWLKEMDVTYDEGVEESESMIKKLNERIEKSQPLTQKLFGKTYNQLNKEELKQYREHLKKIREK